MGRAHHHHYKVPGEVAAIVETKITVITVITVIAVEGLGHDQLRAVGPLLLELPGIPRRIRFRHANVFGLANRHRPPIDAWVCFKAVAARHHRDPDELWREIGFTEEELETPILRGRIHGVRFEPPSWFQDRT